MQAKPVRRQSTVSGDILPADARQSPHLNVEDASNPSRERRKSIFPPVGGHRLSLKPNAAIGMLSRKGKLAGKNTTEEREKSGYAPPQNLEPTYRMEPKAKFYAPRVHTMLKQILEAHLDGFTYNSKFTSTMTKVLADEIKERSKGLGFERYKIVVNIIMGERRDQGIMISSRAAWDAKLDNYATYTFQNKSLFCTASVYGVYAE